MVPGWVLAEERLERTLLDLDKERSSSAAKGLSSFPFAEACSDGFIPVKGNKNELWSIWRALKSMSSSKFSGNMSER